MPFNHAPHAARDLREAPAYSLAEASHYLGVPPATLRAWTLGQSYSARGQPRVFRPVIRLPDRNLRLLSFLNLVEAHVLEALRRQHRVSLQKVRSALNYLAQNFPSPHPLTDHALATDGLSLFVERYGRLINISQPGQLEMRRILEAYLRRVEWDRSGQVARLFPFTRRRELEEPKVIVIDPTISFGRPVLAGTGIPTAVIAERYKAGESVDDLAGDYDRPRSEIEEAIRCELQAA
jgi:uncharacterized protein (DUF433 family)